MRLQEPDVGPPLLALLSAGAVLVTLVLVLVPIYRSSEQELADAHGRRLLAIARTTAEMLPADSLDAIAASGGSGSSAFAFGRSLLKRLWSANGGDISQLANGIADDFLSTLYIATRAKVLIAPAMNTNMFAHQAVRRNLDTLAARGVALISTGRLKTSPP